MIALALAIAIAAAAAPGLPPDGPWTAGADDTTCRATRTFGGGAVSMSIERTLSREWPVLLLTEPAGRTPPRGRPALVVADGTALTLRANVKPDAARTTRTFRFFPEGGELAQLTGSATLGLRGSVVLDKVMLGAASKATIDCIAASLDDLGFDSTLYREGRLAKFKGDVSEAFSQDLYPGNARDRGVQGPVRLLLRTSAAGRVTQCIALNEANVLLARQTCAIAQHLTKVEPPVDKAGHPVDGYLPLNVNWKLN